MFYRSGNKQKIILKGGEPLDRITKLSVQYGVY